MRASSARPSASLWASEGAIYGRYGFGIATRAMRYDLQLDRVALRRDVALPGAAPRRSASRPPRSSGSGRCSSASAPAGPGCSTGAAHWWDQPHLRSRAPPRRRRAAARRGPGRPGRRAGGLRAVRGQVGLGRPRPGRQRDACASSWPRRRRRTPGLWRFLLGLDLVRTLHWRLAPDHDPLDAPGRGQRRDRPPRRRRPVRAAARRRGRAVRAHLRDRARSRARARRPVRAGGSGRYRLRDGRCERTDDPADLALGAEALGAIYLGGTPVTALAAAGRMRELRPGALAEAATAFRGAVEPWCPEIF